MLILGKLLNYCGALDVKGLAEKVAIPMALPMESFKGPPEGI
jgi:hypothetical protein